MLTFRTMLATGLLCVLAMVLMQTPASARAGSQDESADTDGWWGVITEPDVSMRCARSERFYEIGKLERGTVVRVIDVNEAGWAQIKPPPGLTGFALAKDFNLVENGKFAIAPAETTGYYPQGDDPTRSWKKFVIEPDTKLRVLERIEVPQKLFLRVEMPDNVPCAVVASFIRKATPKEVEAWQKRLAQHAADEASKADQTAESAGSDAESTVKANSGQSNGQKPDQQASQSNRQTESKPAPTTSPQETQPEEKPAAKEQKADQETRAPESNDQSSQPKETEPQTGRALTPAETERTAEQEGVDTPKGASDNQADKIELTKQPNLEDLEAMFEALKKEDILDAEIEPVLEGYRAIAADESQPGADRRLARARIVLLELRLKNQASRRRILETLAEAESRIQEAMQQNDEMLRAGAGSRVLIGKLAPSSVYDGRRLPLRYRLRDLITGRTIVYIAPRKEGQLLPYLDMKVRVVGRIIDDPALNVKLMDLVFVEEAGDS